MEKRKTKRAASHARASTQDVLGRVRANDEPINPKWREYYHDLIKARDRLTNRRGELVRDASEEQPSFSLHMADAATDAYDRDFALSMASSEQNSLYEVEQAINRIRSGSYGICEVTGKPIERERLKAIPWTRFSADAEKQLERDGALKRARLAPVEAVPKSSEAEESEDSEEADQS